MSVFSVPAMALCSYDLSISGQTPAFGILELAIARVRNTKAGRCGQLSPPLLLLSVLASDEEHINW
jgi:hypothetical protein